VRRLLILLALAPVLAGCGAIAKPLPPAYAAGPQRAILDWKEFFGDRSGGLGFGVRSFEVTTTGWRAQISIANQTDVPFAFGSGTSQLSQAFGVMLFATGAHSELDRRNANGTMPTIRSATQFAPALPARLGARQTWVGTISAPGPLASGTWVRVVFGPLFPAPAASATSGKRPPALPEALQKANADQGIVWITDHAYELRRYGSTSAENSGSFASVAKSESAAIAARRPASSSIARLMWPSASAVRPSRLSKQARS
jgi:hypothetical protein